MLDWAVTENGVVDAGLVALQVCETGKGLSAVVATERLNEPEKDVLVRGFHNGTGGDSQLTLMAGARVSRHSTHIR